MILQSGLQTFRSFLFRKLLRKSRDIFKFNPPLRRYSIMEINALNNLAASMADMGQMLRQVTEAKLALDDKMLGATIAEGEQAQQTAAGIDTYA